MVIIAVEKETSPDNLVSEFRNCPKMKYHFLSIRAIEKFCLQHFFHLSPRVHTSARPFVGCDLEVHSLHW